MTTTVFVNGVTLTDADWFNDVDQIAYDSDGADYVDYLQSGIATSANRATRTLQAKVGEAWISLTDAKNDDATAVDDTGASECTTALQECIDSANTNGGGVVLVPEGTFLSDSFDHKSKVSIEGIGSGSVLKFKAHATSSNRFIRIGAVGAPVSRAAVRHLKIDGNKAAQTGVGDQFSHAVWIIEGSTHNFVEYCEIVNAQGDGVYIGKSTTTGADVNVVQHNELYDNARQQISLVWGSENRILYNRVSGAIDLEMNLNDGEMKNNLVHGNTGRAQTEGTTAPRISDLIISVSSLNTTSTRTGGNIVTDNHCRKIKFDFQRHLLIRGNIVVGSHADDVYLLDGSGADYVTIDGNTLIANTAVATGLTHILRTRANAYFTVTNNNVDNEAIPFHSYDGSSYNGSAAATQHHFYGNQLSGSGAYRAGTCERASEWARFKITNTNGGNLVATQIGGVKCSLTTSRSGADLVLGSVGNAGEVWRFVIQSPCNATTADAASMTDWAWYTFVASGSNRTVTAYTYDFLSSPPVFATFSFAAAGNTGTFIVDVWF